MDKTTAMRRIAHANRLLAELGYADILDALEELKRMKAQPVDHYQRMADTVKQVDGNIAELRQRYVQQAQPALDAYCKRKIEEALNPTGMRLNDGKARIDIGILSRLYKLAQQAPPADAQDAARGRLLIERGEWLRFDQDDDDSRASTFLAIRVAPRADLSCAPMREDAVDAVMGHAQQAQPEQGERK